MDEATTNAIAEATVRLDTAAKLREQIYQNDNLVNFVEWHAALVAEAQGWASLAVAAAIAGSAPEMPSIGDIMSQLTGGASAD